MRLAAKILAGTTSFLLRVTIYDSTQTTPTGKTGLVYNTSGLTAYYIRSGSSSTTAITLATQTLGTWATGGFKEVDATNMPGVYELSVPNAVIASGAVRATICIKGTNIFCPPIDIELDAVNYQDGVRFGMTALPNVASGGGAGQLATVNRNQQIQLSTGGQVMPQNQWQTPTLLTTAGTVGGVTVAATGLNSFGADGVAIGWLAVIGNEVRTVIDYVDSTRTITVDRPFRVAHPTTEYIYLLASPMSPNVPIFGGIASAGASTTITLAGGSATDNFYNGMMVLINAGTGKGQQRIITGYVGSTKVATVSPAWITNPDSTSQFSVLADYKPAVDSSGAITTGTLSSGALTSIAGAVWNALTASYNTASTFGAFLQAIAPPSASTIATSVWAAATRTLSSFGFNPTVGGYASGQDPATLLLVTPANKLTTDASGNVTVGTIASAALTSIAGAVWNALTASYNTASTFGAYLQALPSASSVATSVWAAGTRTLTSFGTLTTDTATAVWAATTRTLSAFGFSVTVGTNNDKTGYALTSGEHTNIAGDVWNAATASYNTASSFGAYLQSLVTPTASAIATAVWGAATRTLSAFGFGVTVTTNNDKTGYALTAGEHTTIQSDVTTGMTTQGYTATRAGYLDTLSGLVAAIWAAVTDSSGTTTLLSRLSSVRAGYLDKLNITGNVASQADVQAVQNSTWNKLVCADALEIPASGSSTYLVDLLIYNDKGTMQDADSTPTFTAKDAAANSFTSRFGTVTHVSTGKYTVNFTVNSTDTDGDAIVMEAAYAVGGNSVIASSASNLASQIVSQFTATDRSNLNAIKAKTDNLPASPAATADIQSGLTAQGYTTARAPKLDNLDAAISSLATAASLATLKTEADAIKAKTDNLPATPAAQSDVTSAVTTIDAHTDSAVSSLATHADAVTIESAVAAIPTNPLLTTDSRLGHLNADISSRAAPSDIFSTPANKIATNSDGSVNAHATVSGTVTANVTQINGQSVAATHTVDFDQLATKSDVANSITGGAS